MSRSGSSKLRIALTSAFSTLRSASRSSVSTAPVVNSASVAEHYRSDGLRIAQNPFSRDMVEKYGAPGQNDKECFDPYAGVSGGELSKVQRIVKVQSCGVDSLNGEYRQRDVSVIPAGFCITCASNQWDPEVMWAQLSDHRAPWFESTTSGAYIYWNTGDRKWWLVDADGRGKYIVRAPKRAPPSSGWQALPGVEGPSPVVEVSSP
eukprot:TRINITY_DN9359_c0_g1_i1.p1 TRINITY_DN9359_c0_g1~~TRINITY_DN9359_c0_g1_i1.p1  ORF type:complete len:226 (-),score=33.90 TRINITY_DN9359_c0_g1_i1:45-662(-)